MKLARKRRKFVRFRYFSLKIQFRRDFLRADELLLTEMLFSGAFNNLTPQQSVALLSCFVFQENAEMPKLADDMSGLLRQMQVE